VGTVYLDGWEGGASFLEKCKIDLSYLFISVPTFFRGEVAEIDQNAHLNRWSVL